MRKYYSRTGDDGFTARLGQGRLPKYHRIIEAVGTIDEASSTLGMARAVCQAPGCTEILLTIQRDLYHIMAELSASEDTVSHFQVIDDSSVIWLEKQIELLGDSIRMPRDFIVPGDSLAGAMIGLARTTIRRAERRVTQLLHENEVSNSHLVSYLNRLSSLCFVLELLELQFKGLPDPTLAKS